jgi:hypothetical protein
MTQVRDPRDARLQALCLEFMERVRGELDRRVNPPLPEEDPE